jgi:NAD(P)H-dependent nitrite reductase small subunit
MRAVAVAGAEALADGRGLLVEVGAERIAVFRVGEAWFALDDICPHRTGPLSEGSLETTKRGVLVTCPFHGWQFELSNGACATVRGKSVRTYPVRADDTGVWVLLPDDPDEAP